MTSFNFRNSADTLAIATDGCLLIGNIDDVQKLHIRTVPLGEQPRRIAHQVIDLLNYRSSCIWIPD